MLKERLQKPAGHTLDCPGPLTGVVDPDVRSLHLALNQLHVPLFVCLVQLGTQGSGHLASGKPKWLSFIGVDTDGKTTDHRAKISREQQQS